MKIISHRGNIDKILHERENSPDYIDEAISLGYDVEIDLWIDGNNDWYLGHDYGQYKVSKNWLNDRSDKLWVHCKNSKAITTLVGQKIINFFSHNVDKFVLTSNNKVWYHYTKDFDEIFENDPTQIIIPYLDLDTSKRAPILKFYGICTDFPKIISQRLEK